jgi:hypothetical protein
VRFCTVTVARCGTMGGRLLAPCLIDVASLAFPESCVLDRVTCTNAHHCTFAYLFTVDKCRSLVSAALQS